MHFTHYISESFDKLFLHKVLKGTHVGEITVAHISALLGIQLRDHREIFNIKKLSRTENQNQTLAKKNVLTPSQISHLIFSRTLVVLERCCFQNDIFLRPTTTDSLATKQST